MKEIDLILLSEIFKDKSSSQYFLHKETGKIYEVTNKIIDAIEDNYYDHLTTSEMESVKVLEEIYNGSEKYIQIPKLSEGDLINVIFEIIEKSDIEDELKEILLSIASSGSIQKKINKLIRDYSGFYQIWDEFYSNYALKKAKSWALSMGLKVYEPEI
ncbi:MAG: UPF0158 family protein [candidate division WOR-3 bacterium]